MKITEWLVHDWNGAGYTMRFELFDDTDEHPGRYDCYTEEQRQDWLKDNWQFVGVVVTPMRKGLIYAMAEQRLWGVHYGYLAGQWIGRDEIQKDPGEELMRQAYEAAKSVRVEFMES